jgi:hypothetical protein
MLNDEKGRLQYGRAYGLISYFKCQAIDKLTSCLLTVTQNLNKKV